MPLSHQQAKEAFNHVLDNVLECNSLKRTLVDAGVDDLFKLCSVELDDLMYRVSKTKTSHRITIGDKSRILTWRDYIIHRATAGNSIGDDWRSIRQQDFDQFRSSPEYIARKSRSPTAHPIAMPSLKTRSSQSSQANCLCSGIKKDPTLFHLFCCGIKWDPTLFPMLKVEMPCVQEDQDEVVVAEKERASDHGDKIDAVDDVQVLSPTLVNVTNSPKSLHVPEEVTVLDSGKDGTFATVESNPFKSPCGVIEASGQSYAAQCTKFMDLLKHGVLDDDGVSPFELCAQSLSNCGAVFAGVHDPAFCEHADHFCCAPEYVIDHRVDEVGEPPPIPPGSCLTPTKELKCSEQAISACNLSQLDDADDCKDDDVFDIDELALTILGNVNECNCNSFSSKSLRVCMPWEHSSQLDDVPKLLWDCMDESSKSPTLQHPWDQGKLSTGIEPDCQASLHQIDANGTKIDGSTKPSTVLDSDQPTHHPHSCTIPVVTCPCCAGLFGGEEAPIPFSSGHCDGESNHSSKFAGSDFGNEEVEHPSKFVGHNFGHGELTDNEDILEATDPLLSLVEELAAFSAFKFEPDLEDEEELIEFYYCSEEELDEPTSPVLCSEEFPTSDLIAGELMDPMELLRSLSQALTLEALR
jgi:hypothetical protein